MQIRGSEVVEEGEISRTNLESTPRSNLVDYSPLLVYLSCKLLSGACRRGGHDCEIFANQHGRSPDQPLG